MNYANTQGFCSPCLSLNTLG
jgi:hypothetical protein